VSKAKILFWDIETSPIQANTWSLWPNSISHESIIQDFTIICGAWKELGKKKVHVAAITKPYQDKQVVKKLREALSKADILVGHNADKFDFKKFNTRLIYHGLRPLPPIPMVDTLKWAKKIAAFSSNRLDYLSKQLTGQGKVHVDYELWLRIMKGDKKALKEMIAYNKVDVIRLEEVYLKLVPYAPGHPHVGALEKKHRHLSCQKCGSSNIKFNGVRTLAAGVLRRETQCQDCGSYHRIPLSYL
jgi:uncharacterized protein YprB with RNaseH-like and TPR domain